MTTETMMVVLVVRPRREADDVVNLLRKSGVQAVAVVVTNPKSRNEPVMLEIQHSARALLLTSAQATRQLWRRCRAGAHGVENVVTPSQVSPQVLPFLPKFHHADNLMHQHIDQHTLHPFDQHLQHLEKREPYRGYGGSGLEKVNGLWWSRLPVLAMSAATLDDTDPQNWGAAGVSCGDGTLEGLVSLVDREFVQGHLTRGGSRVDVSSLPPSSLEFVENSCLVHAGGLHVSTESVRRLSTLPIRMVHWVVYEMEACWFCEEEETIWRRLQNEPHVPVVVGLYSPRSTALFLEGLRSRLPLSCAAGWQMVCLNETIAQQCREAGFQCTIVARLEATAESVARLEATSESMARFDATAESEDGSDDGLATSNGRSADRVLETLSAEEGLPGRAMLKTLMRVAAVKSPQW